MDVCCRRACHAGPRSGAVGHQPDRSFAVGTRLLMRRCSSPSCSRAAPDTGYGLGVDLGKREGHTIIEHSGEVSGFVSENVVFPDDRAAIVVLTNEMATQAARSIADRIMPDGPWHSNAGAHQAGGSGAGYLQGACRRAHRPQPLHQLLPMHTSTSRRLDDFASSLKPLGSPLTFKETKSEARGGMMFRVFTATFPDRDLRVTTYEMPDGKLEQYLVIP